MKEMLNKFMSKIWENLYKSFQKNLNGNADEITDDTCGNHAKEM